MESYSNRRIAKNTLFLYVRMFLILAVNLYTSRLVLEALGVDDFGTYNVIGGIVALFSTINGALASGSSRFLTFELGKNNLERLKKTFSASFTIHFLIAIVVLILAETVGLWFLNTELRIPTDRMTAANWVYQFSIFSCLIGLTQVPYNAIIIAHERMAIFAYIGFYEALIKLLMVFLLFHFTSSDLLILYSGGICFCSVSVMTFYRWYCIRNFKESHIEIVREKSYYKSMLSFSVWDIIGYTCVAGNSQGINILMNLFFGVTVNAARGITSQVENAILQFSRNFMQAVHPQIIKLFAQENKSQMMNLVFESSKFSCFLLCLVSFPVILEADLILNLWLKQVPEYAPLFLRCTLIASLIRAFATPVVQAVHACGNIKWLNLYSGGISLLLTVPLVYTFYKAGYPPVSAYYITIVLNIIWNYLELFILKHEIQFSIAKYSIHVYLQSLVIVILTLLPVLFIYYKMSPGFARLAITCCSTGVFLVLFIFLIGINRIMQKKLITTIIEYIKK